MKTKWGNAKINKKGYYQITSRKEGNNDKLLHRLIWEDFYGKPVPEGYDIHHINMVRTDNRIQNLQCVERGLHMRFHHKDKVVSEETKQKISKKMKGENHPYWGKKRPKHSERMAGENNPMAKYNLWNINKVQYDKWAMFQGNREPNPCKCFYLKFDGKDVNIGGFIDFITPTIIHDLIEKKEE